MAKVLLLLNVGKGSEFKGKSLEEIEVVDDILECDEEETEEQEVIADIEGEKEQENNMEYLNDSEENGLAPEVDITLEAKTKKTHFNKTLGNRMRWANKEKQLVLKHFKKHIQTKTAPKKHECLTFIEQHPALFSISDWVRIKTLIFNTYRTK